MDRAAFVELRLKLEELTPSLTRAVLSDMESVPELKERYGTHLLEIAGHGTKTFCDVLVGATEFQHPQLLVSEMRWLDKLLAARDIPGNRIERFVIIFREHIQNQLTNEQAKPLLSTLNTAMKQFKKDHKK